MQNLIFLSDFCFVFIFWLTSWFLTEVLTESVTSLLIVLSNCILEHK